MHGAAEDDDREPWEKRQEEREHLEELLEELNWQEDAARDAEAADNPAFYDEDTARDRWSALSHEGDPRTREDIEMRLSRLADALRAVVHPHEIWLHHGKKVYVRKYETPNGMQFVMAGVVKSGNKTRTYYWDSPDEMLNVRQGKLLYSSETEKNHHREASDG